jgi:hypothetical protein
VDRHRRSQLAQRLGRGVGAHALVAADRDRLALGLAHFDGHHLVGEAPIGGRGGRALMAGGRPTVLDTPARCSAAAIARAPRSIAEKLDRPPKNRPTGVRA